MATFIPNITDVIPMPLLYQPNIQFLIQSGLYAKQQYNASLQKINEVYGEYAKSPIFNSAVNQRRNEYIQSLNDYIDKFKHLDLRDPSVVQEFGNLFKPIANDALIVNHMSISRQYLNMKDEFNYLKNTQGIREYDKDGNLIDLRTYDSKTEAAIDGLMNYYANLKLEDAMNYKMYLPVLRTYNVQELLRKKTLEFYKEFKGAKESEIYVLDHDTGKVYNITDLNGAILPPMVGGVASSAGYTISGGSVSVIQQQPVTANQQPGAEKQQTAVSGGGQASGFQQVKAGRIMYVVNKSGGDKKVVDIYNYLTEYISNDPMFKEHYKNEAMADYLNVWASTGYDSAKTMQYITNDINNYKKELFTHFDFYLGLSNMIEEQKKRISDEMQALNYSGLDPLSAMVLYQKEALLEKYNTLSEVKNNINKSIEDKKSILENEIKISDMNLLASLPSIANYSGILRNYTHSLNASISLARNMIDESVQTLSSGIGDAVASLPHVPGLGGLGGGANKNNQIVPVKKSYNLEKVKTDKQGNIVKDTQGNALKENRTTYIPNYIDPNSLANKDLGKTVEDYLKSVNNNQNINIRYIDNPKEITDVNAKNIINTLNTEFANLTKTLDNTTNTNGVIVNGYPYEADGKFYVPVGVMLNGNLQNLIYEITFK